MKRSQTGFTLIEVMVALGIFALIAVMSFQAINTLTQAQQKSQVLLQNLTDLQKALMIWERDLRQVTPRAVTDEYGETQPYMYQPDGALLEFSTNNYYDWTGQTGHTLQRVRYSFTDGQLIREAWAFPDRSRLSEPQKLILLTDLKDAKVDILSADANQDKTSTENASILASSNAVALVIEHRQFGSITRTLMLYPL